MSGNVGQASVKRTDSGPPTSPTLLDRLRTWHDETAWNLFIDRYGSLLHQWGRARLQDPGEVDEVRQLVLWEVARRLTLFHYDGRKSFRGWLKTLFRSRLSDFLKQKRRRLNREREVALIRRPREVDRRQLTDPVTGSLPSQTIERTEGQVETNEILARVRSRVSEKTWSIFWEIAVEGQPVAETARRHSMRYASAFAAFSRVSRMLQQEASGTRAS
ncbi:MAG: sigma-70 family RNA polymerase sigma factor [Planctomyces sp.]|nr:sigma-70 family RNA polymerase sigma factor [Planctomyces sp.]